MSERKRHSKEFKQEAINMVLLQGLIQEEVAHLLSIPSRTLANWIIRFKANVPAGEPGAVSPFDLATENSPLYKELAKATLERDIQKKAAAYFAADALQGTRSYERIPASTRSMAKAFPIRPPRPGYIHHSDRGSRYCALEYLDALERAGFRISMSSRGSCHDTAPTESIRVSLKQEPVYHEYFKTRFEAKSAIKV